MRAHDPTVATTIERWLDHPAAMVREEFGAEPDPWQLEALEAFPHHNRIAMKASKGPGKTCVMAWMLLNFLATRPHPRIGATSITGDNLFANLWPEIAKWMGRSKFFTHTFEWQKTRIVHRQHPATWWAQARTWPKAADPQKQADALAGLHEDYAAFFMDESGGMPQSLMATAEGVLAGGIETKVIQGGNPTSRTGPLYRACVPDLALWKVITITGDPDNPKRSSRVSIEWARQQIQAYGASNPWVLINVFGEFPRAALNTLLGDEDVLEAMRRQHHPDVYSWAQRRFGIDVARYGDDRTVIFPRQGKRAFRPHVMRHTRGSTVSNDIAAEVIAGKGRWGSELELIDATGGWAAGARDALVTAGVTPIDVQFAAPALKPEYANRRAEIWFEGAKWVLDGGQLPNVPDLVAELCEPTYTVDTKGRLILEPKDVVKERLARSPDLADALMLTFGFPDVPKASRMRARRGGYNDRALGLAEYDPFNRRPDDGVGRAVTE